MWWLEEHNKILFFWSCVTLQIQAARKSRGKVVWKKKKIRISELPFSLFKQQKSLLLWKVDKVLSSESGVRILIRAVGGLPGTCCGDPSLGGTKLPCQFAEEEWERGLWKL